MPKRLRGVGRWFRRAVTGEVDGYVGYTDDYACSHAAPEKGDDVPRKDDVPKEVANAASALRNTIRLAATHNAGRWSRRYKAEMKAAGKAIL
jgi:hypothetical protein